MVSKDAGKMIFNNLRLKKWSQPIYAKVFLKSKQVDNNCSNSLRAGGIHRHDKLLVCDRCHAELYGPAKVRGHVVASVEFMW